MQIAKEKLELLVGTQKLVELDELFPEILKIGLFSRNIFNFNI